MRGFTKSVVSYTWSSSLFGLQQMANFMTPQGWRQTDQAGKSFERITKATTEELSEVAATTFKFADNLQRKSVDIVFDGFGLFDRGCERSQSAPAGAPGSSTVSGVGGQAVSLFCQGLEALGQTAGIVGQAVGGMIPGSGYGGCSSTQTGWGPVPPPPA